MSGDGEGERGFVFEGITVRSPLSELTEVYERKMRGLRSTHDGERARRLEAAFRIAREQLEKALASEIPTPPSEKGS